MRSNSTAESALHIVILLAAAPGGRELAAADLAAFHDLSPDTLAKVLQQLTAAGVVAGASGRNGGYRLARPAHTVSALEVVDALKGVAPDFNCREIRRVGVCAAKNAKYSNRCAIARAMDAAALAWRQSLQSVTIAHLSSAVAAEAPREVVANTQLWLGDHCR